MQLFLRSKSSKAVVMVLEIAAFLALIGWVCKTYAADLVSRKADVPGLELATRLDPGNSEYHLKLGRSFQYDPANIDIRRSIAELGRAAELSPYDAEAWVAYAAALQLEGTTAEAEAALRRADFLAPNLPGFQWAIGNFFLLHGDTDQALRHFRAVLNGSNDYDYIIFNIAWKASGDADKILTELIPPNVYPETAYLYYLVGSKKYKEAENVWTRMMNEPHGFDPAWTTAYMDNLITSGQASRAYQVWTDLIKKGLIRVAGGDPNQNLVVDGGFEDQPLNMGFDWRIPGVEGVSVGRDEANFHSGGHSLLIQFAGKQNFNYHHVYQFVKVAAGRSYRLRGFMRTEAITTDSGPRLEVRDAYDARWGDKFSDQLTGTTPGWSQLTVDFTTGQKAEMLVIGVARLPSQKLDNLIGGKVWVDDVSLIPLSEQSHTDEK